MSAHAYVRFISTLTIVINLIVGIGALYLIERIVPAIEEILNENAYSVSSVLKMQGSLVGARFDSEGIENSEHFWQAFDNAKSNVTIEGEGKIIFQIENLATRYWNGDGSALNQLSQNLNRLSELNLESMNKKNKMAKTLGLAGAWSLGFLILFTLVLQLSLRKRLFDSLVHPTTSLLSVITDYSEGNYQRRYSSSPETVQEIKRTGEVLNKILDENLSSKIT